MGAVPDAPGARAAQPRDGTGTRGCRRGAENVVDTAGAPPGRMGSAGRGPADIFKDSRWGGTAQQDRRFAGGAWS